MASTNYLQWNPTAANQEDDAAYLADSQRSGGATNPSIFNALLANKAFFQWSTFATAFAQAAVALGFNFNDTSLSTLTSTIETLLTGGAQRPALKSVAYAASLVFDASTSNGFAVTLTGNLSFTFINLTDGQPINLAFTQDGTGSHTVTFPSNLHGWGTVDPGANNCTIQSGFVMFDGIIRPNTPPMVTD